MRLTPRGLALAGLVLASIGADLDAGDVTKVPAFEQFLVVPLRVHILDSKEFAMTACQISDAEVTRSVAAINAIWSKAGISFGLDSIVHEPAGQIERFQATIKLNDGELPNFDPFAMLLPQTPSRIFAGAQLYIFHELPLNGFYIPAADAAVTLERPQLRQVEGGGADPMARVAARFLGEAIGLPPGREDEVGLASGGTNGVGLSEIEIARVRQMAKTVPGVLEVDDMMKQAAAATAKDVTRARRLYTWLAAIPGAGPGAAEAKQALAALPEAERN